MQQVQHKPEHKACAARVSTSRCHQVQQKARCSRFSTSQNIRHALRGSAQADAIRFSTSRCNKARCSRFSASQNIRRALQGSAQADAIRFSTRPDAAGSAQADATRRVLQQYRLLWWGTSWLCHTVCKNDYVTQCAKTSHSVRKHHIVCKKITQCAKTSHSVQKHHTVCKNITQCANISHSVQKHHTVCKYITQCAKTTT